MGNVKLRDNVKCKEWERQRRDRLNDAFKALAQLLPHHDPAKDPPKIDVLEKSTQFIKELRLSNSRLLTQQTQEDETNKKIKELQDELNKLILRVKQLTLLLNQAKIPIPMGPSIKVLGKKRLKWTKQLTNDDLENSKRNRTEIQCIKQKGQDIGGVKKGIENSLTIAPTITIITSPLKEANLGDINNSIPDKMIDVSTTEQAIQSVITTPLVEPTTPNITIPSVFENPPNLPTTENPTVPHIITKPLITSDTVLPLSPIQQSTTIPNIGYPLQTTYILTRCPISQAQPTILTRFTIGTNPRIILSKPPLSSSGDIPKVAIPALRKRVKSVPLVKRRRRKLAKPKNVAKSCQTDKIVAPGITTSPPVAIGTSPIPDNSSELEPILVDITSPVESEIKSQGLVNQVSRTDKVVNESNAIGVSEVVEEKSVSASAETNLVEEMLTDVSEPAKISELVLVTSPIPLSSLTELSSSKSTNPSSPVIVSESNENERENCSTVENIEYPTEKESGIDVLQEFSEPDVNSNSENVKEGSTDQIVNLKNIENLEEVTDRFIEETEEGGTQSEETEPCINTDKISECIARSIDLIDHPEAELMELGTDWAVVGVGETHSPKSPISPTQMFLSMFPLLPRESIVTAAGGVETSVQHNTHGNSGVKNSSSHFGSNSTRSSFFIDSMLPEQVHPQISVVDSTILPISTMDNSICLAMTPITPSCVQQNQSLNNNYSSPPSFQSLANVVPNNSSSSPSVITTAKSVVTKAPQTVSAGFYQIPPENSTPSLHSNTHHPTSSRNFTSSITYDNFQTPLPRTQNSKSSYARTQQFYTPEPYIEKPRSPPVTNSVSHTISQMFNSFVNNPSTQRTTQPFNENYSYYPQEVTALYNPQSLIPSSSTSVSNKYSSPNSGGRLGCPAHSQSNEVPRIKQHQDRPGVPSSQPQPQVGLFRPASNVFIQTGSILNMPHTKQPDSTDKLRANIQSKLPSNPNTRVERVPVQHFQAFSHSQYVQPPPRQYPPVSETFNFVQNQQRQEVGLVQNLNQFENRNSTNRSFQRSPASNTSTAKQTSTRTISNTEFNADFLAYSAPAPAQSYQGHQHSALHNSYEMTSRPVTSVSIAPGSTSKTAYRPPVQTGVTMQHPPATKPHRPPFYLPDPPPPSMPTPTQYEPVGPLPNYSNQSSNISRQTQQPGQSHYSHNFVPQFYNNRNTTTDKDYNVFSNPHVQNTPEQPTDFYQSHNLTMPPQQHQQQATEPLPSLNPKKSTPIPKFTTNNTQHSINSRTNNITQNRAPQIPVSRPVNWMTDPPHKKPISGPNRISGGNNPFSVSKLVGNNSNNYCTEALIRKNPNQEWNDFQCFAPPPAPPVLSSVPGSSAIPVNPLQPTPHSSFPSQPQPVQNDYFSHNYPMNTNFGNFDTHSSQHLHYNISNQMNSQSHGHGHGHIQNSTTHHSHGTTTSVSNFNLSSIFPEINDKRGNNNNNSAGNCGYYPSNSIK